MPKKPASNSCPFSKSFNLPNTLDLTQLLRVPHIDSGLCFDISPDESQIVFSWNKSGTWELYDSGIRELAPVSQTASCLTPELVGAKFSPRFSPDGTRLAYALDPDGSESYHIFIHNFQTNTAFDLTPDIAYAHQPNFAWSPDGERLAVLCDRQGQFALYLLPTDGTLGRLLKNVFRPCWDVTWSPDGQWLALEAESTASNHSIYVIPINRPRKATKIHTMQLKIKGEVLNAQNPAWSPDSKFLAFSGENGEWHDIGLFNVDTREITWVNRSVGDDTQPAWSRSGEAIGWVHAEGARTSFQLKEGSADIKQIQIGAGVHYFPQFTSDSVVILYEDPSHPCDLWKINLADGSTQQLTNSLPEELPNAKFIQPEEIGRAHV